MSTQNDLDLDLFCKLIMHEEAEHLKHLPCFNSYRENARGIVEVVAEEKHADHVEDDFGLLESLP
jgi:hypothetical protein